MEQTYKKMDKSLLDCGDDGWIFEQVEGYVEQLLGEEWHPIINVEKLTNLPKCLKNIYYSWWFSAEIGGNGFGGYVFNDYESYSSQEFLNTHKALLDINAVELVQRFESALILASKNKVFSEIHDSQLFCHMKNLKQFNSEEKIDNGIYDLIEAPFNKLVADYIRKHNSEIFEL